MKFTVVTVLPELLASSFAAGVVGRAVQQGLLTVATSNPRDFTSDRHRTVDDTPYGGGPGMVMKVEPLAAAIAASGEGRRIFLGPGGPRLTQQKVRELATHKHLILVCGRYEGVDQRVIDHCIDEELSIGDFILSGGELAALAVIDAVARLVPGVLGEIESASEESFSDGLLEYPQYTRPQTWSVAGNEHSVPAMLSSGNHAAIALWRKERSFEKTARVRPDLWRAYRDRYPKQLRKNGELCKRTYVALVHYPVVDRTGAVVSTSITNLDIHDIARAAMTYDLAGYFIISPVEAQRDKALHVAAMWREQLASEDRTAALRRVIVSESVEAAVEQVSAASGPPHVVVTSANPQSFPDCPQHSPIELIRAAELRPSTPVLLLFGTGFGLAPQQSVSPTAKLSPIRGGRWNHLSVRSAVAITLDRLFGDQ